MRIVLLAIFHSLILLLTSPVLHAAERHPWVVESVSGDVYVRQTDKSDNGRMQGIVNGTLLWAPFEVITGSNGRARLQRGADRIEIAPNSVIEFGADQHAADGVLARVKQALGSVLFEIDHKPGREFEAETPFLVSVVKGTRFTVDVGNNSAAVTLHDGRLQVFNSARTHDVFINSGQTAYFNPDDGRIHVSKTEDLGAELDQLINRIVPKSDQGEGGLSDFSAWSSLQGKGQTTTGLIDLLPGGLSESTQVISGVAAGIGGAGESVVASVAGQLGDAGQALAGGGVGGQLGSGSLLGGGLETNLLIESGLGVVITLP